MTALAHSMISTAPELNQIHLIPDGNSHRPDLCPERIGFNKPNLASEAMIPSIRMVATLIAAARHDFNNRSPEHFTEGAGWFAARIIVLNARIFHLDVTLKPMLDTANRRAQVFAQQHSLPFTAAKMRMSLHAGRPANLLIIETDFHLSEKQSLANNSGTLATQCLLPKLF